MSLLQDSYLGGSGSRGYGKVAFEDISLKVKTVEDYSSAGAGRIVNIGGKITFSVGELLSRFEEVKSKIME
jgi:CRISPR-associated protein Csm3